MAFVSSYINQIPENIGDDLFLDLIKSRPWLYDKRHNGYGDQVMTLNAWKDISTVLKESVADCMSRWARLKSNYHKENMLREKETASGSGQPKRRSWSLYENMKPLFQSDQIARKTYSNVLPDQNFSAVPTKKKRKTQPPNIIQSAFNNFNATAQKLIELAEEKTSTSHEQNFSDASLIFGELVAAELDSMSEEESLCRRKLIYKLMSEI